MRQASFGQRVDHDAPVALLCDGLDSRCTSGMSGQQWPLGDDQIGQPEQAEQLRRVLGQSLVARLAMTEQVLDPMEWVLHLGPNARLHLLDFFQQPGRLERQVQLPAFARLHRDVPVRSLRLLALVTPRWPASPKACVS